MRPFSLDSCASNTPFPQPYWLLRSPHLLQVLILFVLYFGMNAIVKEKTVELFAFIIAAVLQLLRTAYEYAFCFSAATTASR